MPKVVLIIANKIWEVEPVINACLNSTLNFNLVNPRKLDYPRSAAPGEAKPRAIWRTKGSPIKVELWAVQDVMDPFVPSPPVITIPSQYYSSSSVKFSGLKKIFDRVKKPSLVIAFGTAACPDAQSHNGSVAMGSNIFIHDGNPNDQNPYSDLRSDKFDQLLSSSVPDSFFDQIKRQSSLPDTQDKFITNMPLVSLNPAPSTLIIDKQYLGLSEVNVTNPAQYATKDAESIAAVNSSHTGKQLISVETTHGLIRLHANDTPFAFISAFANRVGSYGTEVLPKINAQNFTASFDGGVFIAWLINELLTANVAI